MESNETKGIDNLPMGISGPNEDVSYERLKTGVESEVGSEVGSGVDTFHRIQSGDIQYIDTQPGDALPSIRGDEPFNPFSTITIPDEDVVSSPDTERSAEVRTPEQRPPHPYNRYGKKIVTFNPDAPMPDDLRIDTQPKAHELRADLQGIRTEFPYTQEPVHIEVRESNVPKVVAEVIPDSESIHLRKASVTGDRSRPPFAPSVIEADESREEAA